MKRFILSLIFSVAAIGSLIGIIAGPLTIGGVPLTSPLRLLFLQLSAAVSGAALISRLWRTKSESTEISGRLLPALMISALGWGLALVFSDFIERRFVFYLSSGVRREVVAISIISAIVWGIFRRRGGSEQSGSARISANYGEALLFFFQILATVSYLQCANGRLLFSDDHPSFLYRYQELLHQFPNVPYYNIDWNGGYVAREFFATGAIGSFLLFLPFIASAADFSSYEGARIYTLLIPYLFIFLVPWSIYLAARLFGLPRQAASIAAILSLGPSLGYFEWVLKYGTIGFALSSGLLPLIVALSIRLGFGPALPRWSEVFAFVIAAYLFLSWPLAIITLLPLGLVWIYAVLRGRSAAPFYSSRQRWLRIALFSGLTLLLQVPTVTVLVRESKVGELVTSNSLPGTAAKGVETRPAETDEGERDDAGAQSGEGAARFIKRLQENLVKVNPLILLYLVPGILILGRGTVRQSIIAVGLGTIALHLIGPYFKPQFELRRMIYPALFIGSIAAAAGIWEFFERLVSRLTGGDRRGLTPDRPGLDQVGLDRTEGLPIDPALNGPSSGSRISGLAAGTALALLSGLFFVSPLTVVSIYSNRSIEKFQFASPLIDSLAQAIAKDGGGGRTFFLGFTLHELGSSGGLSQDGGHLAPLANFSKKPLYAFDFTHSKWSSVDPIPLQYRSRGSAGIEEFLDLVNATAVVTHQKEWVDYCKNDPRYQEVFRQDRFRLFKRTAEAASYFLKGAGEIKPAEEGFKVQLKTAEAVLKFRYFPRLRPNPSAGVELFPVHAFDEEAGGGRQNQVSYVGIRLTDPAKLNQPVTIGYFPR